MEAGKACPLTFRHVASVIDFLFPHEAFGRARVSKLWLQAASALDAREAVLRLRSCGWASNAPEASCLQDATFCKQLLRDFHTYLSQSSLQLAYVSYQQHLLFVDPEAEMTRPPQGADLFPINKDADYYRCVIDTFSMDQLWWRCLEQELFHWPWEEPERSEELRGGESIRGFGGDRPVQQPDSDEEADDNDRREDLDDADHLGGRDPDRRGGEDRREDLDDADRIGGRDPDRRGGEDRAEGRCGGFSQEGAASSSSTLPRLCEPVPGYRGSCATPKLPEDVLAVLALNAAWFSYSFWVRKLQGILLLRDGRYLLVAQSEMQGTIDSQATGLACRCFVADSLAAIVMFAQDNISRQLLRTRIPNAQDRFKGKPRVKDNATERVLKMPRAEGDTGQEEVFGKFPKATEVLTKMTHRPLYCNLNFDQELARANLKPGVKCRVRRTSPTFLFESASTKASGGQSRDEEAKGWDVPDGPVSPSTAEEYVEQLRKSDARFISFSGGCHLGLKAGKYYDAEVRYVDASAGMADVTYTDFTEWADGNSGHTGGRGSSGKNLPPLQESDVELERITVLPSDELYLKFQAVWDPCGAFSSMGIEFEEQGPGGPSLAKVKERAQKQKQAEPECSFLELADLLRDTKDAHIHRCDCLAQGAQHIPEDVEDVALLTSALRSYRESTPADGKIWPPNDQMQQGKKLMLRLLRKEKAWKEWVDRGGESPFFIATLYKRQRFVRLVDQPEQRPAGGRIDGY